MNPIILACSSMEGHLKAAQTKMKTNHSVVFIDRKYHENPKRMRREIIETMQSLPPEVDTILAAMGFCGGSWSEVPLEKRIVIPRVDDCITLLLHTDNVWFPNLKKAGHFYLLEEENELFSLKGMRQSLCEKYGEKKSMEIFHAWFETYTDVDIIDTGQYDCYSESYTVKARENAEVIQCPLHYVKGSNIILEKLVSGCWDQQFLVAEPGRLLSEMDFLKLSHNL